jgi:hypothetical protein
MMQVSKDVFTRRGVTRIVADIDPQIVTRRDDVRQQVQRRTGAQGSGRGPGRRKRTTDVFLPLSCLRPLSGFSVLSSGSSERELSEESAKGRETRVLNNNEGVCVFVLY